MSDDDRKYVYLPPHMTKTEVRSYRIKRFRIGRRDLFHLFRMRGSEWPDYITVHTAMNIPDDSRILQCGLDQSGWSFEYIVEHPSFPEVPDGQLPDVENINFQSMIIQRNPVRQFDEDMNPIDDPNKGGDYPVVHALSAELDSIRMVFHGLLNDGGATSDSIEAAYRSGYNKCINELMESTKEIASKWHNGITNIEGLSEMLKTYLANKVMK